MIIVKIAGGLGNQMFQYAAGIALAEKLGMECKFDLDWFDNHHIHNGLELSSVFNLKLPVASSADKKLVFGFFQFIYQWLGDKLFSKKLSFLRRPFLLLEGDYDHYYSHHIFSKHIYMVGYWQGEIYTLKSDGMFVFSRILNDATQKWLKTIQNRASSVSLHVRRGDYISDKKSANAMGTCTIDYYQAAINLMANQLEEPIFFIFSDDLNWCRESLAINHPVHYVDGNIGDHSSFDMLLMSACRHHIIANSSFSWWGARLAKSKKQIVIAPKPWFNTATENEDKLYCDEWIVLDKYSGKIL
jgi:hypothetical protein